VVVEALGEPGAASARKAASNEKPAAQVVEPPDRPEVVGDPRAHDRLGRRPHVELRSSFRDTTSNVVLPIFEKIAGPQRRSARRPLQPEQRAGAESFAIVAIQELAEQAINKAFDIGWTPVRCVTGVSQSISSTMTPAGREKSKGAITAVYDKDPTDARWRDDAGSCNIPGLLKNTCLDDYRMAARIERGEVQLLIRSGLDWTAKYPATPAAFANSSEDGLHRRELWDVRIRRSRPCIPIGSRPSTPI
jgi:hypothetical protein